MANFSSTPSVAAINQASCVHFTVNAVDYTSIKCTFIGLKDKHQNKMPQDSTATLSHKMKCVIFHHYEDQSFKILTTNCISKVVTLEGRNISWPSFLSYLSWQRERIAAHRRETRSNGTFTLIGGLVGINRDHVTNI